MGNEKKSKINSRSAGLRNENYAIVLFVQCRTVAVDFRCHAIGRFKKARFYLISVYGLDGCVRVAEAIGGPQK